jgi:polyphosphate kinase
VEVDLIVRGMCALRPGIRGVSDRIRVRSIVGRFLEHSRIFYFANGGQEEIYLGSADWMPRNLYERVEVVFPVKSEALRERVYHEILTPYLADVAKARLLKPDGTYVRADAALSSTRLQKSGALFNAQEYLVGLAEGRKETAEQVVPSSTPQRGRRQRRVLPAIHKLS